MYVLFLCILYTVYRDEIIQEVYSVPYKRLDNEVTRVNQDIGSMLLYSNIYLKISTLYINKIYSWNKRLLVSLLASISVPILGYMYIKEEYKSVCRNIGVIANILYFPLLYQISNYYCYQYGKQLLYADQLDEYYMQKYESTGNIKSNTNATTANSTSTSNSVTNYTSSTNNTNMIIPSRISQRPNEFYSGLWYKSIKPHIQQVLSVDHLYQSYSNQALSLFYVKSLVTDADITHLESVMDINIIRLRKRATKWLSSQNNTETADENSVGKCDISVMNNTSSHITTFAHLESEGEEDEVEEDVVEEENGKK